MKKALLSATLVLLCLATTMAQVKKQDSVAILIIDRMTDIIGDLQSCSFHLNVSTDVSDTSYALVKKFMSYDVYMSGSDKMLVNAHGYRGHRQFMYNGTQLAYYSYDENNYGIIPTPNTTIKTIDSLHDMYDMEFPAADFFYPSFTDDLLEDVDTLLYIGESTIEGKEYAQIVASNQQVTYQFWISVDAYILPAKFVITYKNKPGNPQYEATFSDWDVNPDLPGSMFDFQPPPGAREVRILSKANN